jgi:putative molybdopterin biosynthesis protein
MEQIKHLNTAELFKVLGNSKRLKILRLLMRQPATLSQLSKELSSYPSQVRHHLKQLEAAGLVKLTRTQVVRGFVEKYYQATSRAYLVTRVIVPMSDKDSSIMAFGSHDIALELLAEQFSETSTGNKLFSIPVGSLDGLIALRQGICQIAACHLLDTKTGNYNSDFVRHFFPGKSMRLLNLTYRQQGLLVKKGNPISITSLTDLSRKDVRFINRQSGSGTRLWLDQQLALLQIDQSTINGYEREINTHSLVGRAIQKGHADVGIGVQAIAEQLTLDFIPLFEERFDLLVAYEYLSDPKLQPIFDLLQSAQLRQAINHLAGYDAARTGDMVVVEG